MIRLYYSGAPKALESQNNPIDSLGGFISNSLVGNNKSNSIFSNLTTSKDNEEETKLIVLKNEGATISSEIKIWVDHSDLEYSEIFIAGVIPFEDNCSNLKFENIQSSNDTPIYAEFEKFDSVNNALLIDSFESNSYIGLWMNRKVSPNKSLELSNLNSCESIINDQIDLNQIIENFSLKIEY